MSFLRDFGHKRSSGLHKQNKDRMETPSKTSRKKVRLEICGARHQTTYNLLSQILPFGTTQSHPIPPPNNAMHSYKHYRNIGWCLYTSTCKSLYCLVAAMATHAFISDSIPCHSHWNRKADRVVYGINYTTQYSWNKMNFRYVIPVIKSVTQLN